MKVCLLCLSLLASLLAGCNPAPVRVVVEWTTATEVNTVGFNLYRSEQADGPYRKANKALIVASGDTVGGGKYRYEDSGLTPGQTYYYQLEDVEADGASTRHGPITVTAPLVSEGSIALLSLGAAVVIAGLYLVRRRTKGHGIHQGQVMEMD